MICLCLTGDTLRHWEELAARYAATVDLLELRLDLLRPGERDPEAIARWIAAVPRGLPWILTVRRPADLGAYEGDEAQRLLLLDAITRLIGEGGLPLKSTAPATHSPPPDHPAWYLDMELDRRGDPQWDRLAMKVRAHGGAVIRSHHSVDGTPGDLPALMARLSREGREVPKLAVQPLSDTDVVALVTAAREYRRRMGARPAVWLAMGEYGLPTRGFPALLGSHWTYAVPAGSAPLAPGQLTPEVLRETYRYGEVTPAAAVYGLIGSPVAHSGSPKLHNQWYRDARRNAIYLPFRLDSFSRFPQLAERFNLRGVSVTVPHKEAALAFALGEGQGGATAAARAIGAANTLVAVSPGVWQGHNTDAQGFIAPLQERQWIPEPGAPVAVAGCGGAARAVVAALQEHRLEVWLFNRTRSRAEALARHFSIPPERTGTLEELQKLADVPWAMVVQATSLGMHGEDPLEGYSFRGSEIVYDLIYNPPVTPLLQRAGGAGCRTLNGADMLRAQGEVQRDLFLSDALSDSLSDRSRDVGATGDGEAFH